MGYDYVYPHRVIPLHLFGLDLVELSFYLQSRHFDFEGFYVCASPLPFYLRICAAVWSGKRVDLHQVVELVANVPKRKPTHRYVPN